MTSVATDTRPTAFQEAIAGRFLTCFLGREEYGIQILKVREIIGMGAMTPLPGTADFVKGVINLRGRIIPVIDMRLKFGMERLTDTTEACIVVVEVERIDRPNMLMGCYVDTVSSVRSVDVNCVEASPLGSQGSTDYILALGKVEQKVLILFDIEVILASAEDRLVATRGSSR